MFLEIVNCSIVPSSFSYCSLSLINPACFEGNKIREKKTQGFVLLFARVFSLFARSRFCLFASRCFFARAFRSSFLRFFIWTFSSSSWWNAHPPPRHKINWKFEWQSLPSSRFRRFSNSVNDEHFALNFLASLFAFVTMGRNFCSSSKFFASTPSQVLIRLKVSITVAILPVIRATEGTTRRMKAFSPVSGLTWSSMYALSPRKLVFKRRYSFYNPLCSCEISAPLTCRKYLKQNSHKKLGTQCQNWSSDLGSVGTVGNPPELFCSCRDTLWGSCSWSLFPRPR